MTPLSQIAEYTARVSSWHFDPSEPALGSGYFSHVYEAWYEDQNGVVENKPGVVKVMNLKQSNNREIFEKEKLFYESRGTMGYKLGVTPRYYGAFDYLGAYGVIIIERFDTDLNSYLFNYREVEDMLIPTSMKDHVSYDTINHIFDLIEHKMRTLVSQMRVVHRDIHGGNVLIRFRSVQTGAPLLLKHVEIVFTDFGAWNDYGQRHIDSFMIDEIVESRLVKLHDMKRKAFHLLDKQLIELKQQVEVRIKRHGSYDVFIENEVAQPISMSNARFSMRPLHVHDVKPHHTPRLTGTSPAMEPVPPKWK